MPFIEIDNYCFEVADITGLEYSPDHDSTFIFLGNRTLQIRDPRFYSIMKKFITLDRQFITAETLFTNEANIDKLLSYIKKINGPGPILDMIQQPDKYIQKFEDMQKEQEAAQQMNFQFGMNKVEVN